MAASEVVVDEPSDYPVAGALEAIWRNFSVRLRQARGAEGGAGVTQGG
jgi:hypothetical protein